MTRIDFQKNYSEQLKLFLVTPAGQNLLNVLSSMRPGYEFPAQGHLLDENRGAIRGYELCIRNIVGLSMPYAVQQDVEANYGVPSPK